jgi:hypothetical protein
MGKTYKHKTCVYCAKPGSSTAPDHVVCRAFFPIEHRDHLPQVPACDDCNREKAKLEHYLTTVMPFGATHGDAASTLGTMVPKRLGRNEALHRELSNGIETVLVTYLEGAGPLEDASIRRRGRCPDPKRDTVRTHCAFTSPKETVADSRSQSAVRTIVGASNRRFRVQQSEST